MDRRSRGTPRVEQETALDGVSGIEKKGLIGQKPVSTWTWRRCFVQALVFCGVPGTVIVLIVLACRMVGK